MTGKGNAGFCSYTLIIILYFIHGDKIPVVCVVVTLHLGVVVVDAGTLY